VEIFDLVLRTNREDFQNWILSEYRRSNKYIVPYPLARKQNDGGPHLFSPDEGHIYSPGEDRVNWCWAVDAVIKHLDYAEGNSWDEPVGVIMGVEIREIDSDHIQVIGTVMQDQQNLTTPPGTEECMNDLQERMVKVFQGRTSELRESHFLTDFAHALVDELEPIYARNLAKEWAEVERSADQGPAETSAGDKLSIGGDVVERDKIESAGGHIIHAGPGATVIVVDGNVTLPPSTSDGQETTSLQQ
jgi:hypothetical protein